MPSSWGGGGIYVAQPLHSDQKQLKNREDLSSDWGWSGGMEARLPLGSLPAVASASCKHQSEVVEFRKKQHACFPHQEMLVLHSLLENMYDTVIRFVLLKNLQ